MPNLNQHQSANTTKMLLIGESGSGKTGALCSLAAAGYNMRVLDFDNGLDVVANLIKGGKYPADCLERFEYVTLTEKMKPQGGILVPDGATAWPRMVGSLANWDPQGSKLGPIDKWTDQEVLVIDSLSMLCNAAMNYTMSLNGGFMARVEQSHWYIAQQMIERVMQTLYDEHIKCNVIVMCHVQYQELDGGIIRGLPAALGKALAPRLGRYFNSLLLAQSTGVGTAAKKVIRTVSVPMIELKNSNPAWVKPQYPLETGLADYFADVRKQGKAPAPVPVAKP